MALFNSNCKYDIGGKYVCDKYHPTCKANIGSTCSPLQVSACCQSICLPVYNETKNKLNWNEYICQAFNTKDKQ